MINVKHLKKSNVKQKYISKTVSDKQESHIKWCVSMQALVSSHVT